MAVFSTDHVPKMDQFNLNESVDAILGSMRPNLANVVVKREYGGDIPLTGDSGMIGDSIFNVIQNALDAMSKNPSPMLSIRIDTVQDEVVCTVEDNGCGIPPEYIDRVFDPAFSLKGSRDRGRSYDSRIAGMGYGLFSARRCAEMHGGRIGLDSEVGKGTTVRLVLPQMHERFTDVEWEKLDQGKIVTSKNVLVVEDEEAISRILHRLLSAAPSRHRVDIVTDGETALEYAQKNSYDIISLDYLLSGKLNGLDVYRHLRQRDEALPILFVSGNIEFEESLRQLRETDPCVEFLKKPFSTLEYVLKINECLQGETSS